MSLPPSFVPDSGHQAESDAARSALARTATRNLSLRAHVEVMAPCDQIIPARATPRAVSGRTL